MSELGWIDGQANPIHHLTKFQERKNIFLDNNSEERENMVPRYAAFSYPCPSEVKAPAPPDYSWYGPRMYHTYRLAARRANLPYPSNFVDRKDQKEVMLWRPEEEEAVLYGLQRKKLCSCHESCEKMIPIT